MRKWMALLLALVLLCACARAEITAPSLTARAIAQGTFTCSGMSTG